ncbi:MAG: outer membrane protein assembly factor BamA [Bacteroidales bacterium]|nr:outer membrane protein assembly factor BamA [Bacteroidales bacterium]
MKSRLLLLIMVILMALPSAYSQTPVNYDSPKEYTIGGISVSGIKYLNTQAIIQISGLKVGQKVKVPGDQITHSVEKLWKQGLFSDVSIGILKTTPDGLVFLNIKLEERPKLNKVEYKGVRNGEKEDLNGKINLIPGTKITEHTITKTKNIIAEHFYDKGFYYVDVRVMEVPDTNLQNVSNLLINVDKGHKVKIRNITPSGNEAFSEKRIRKGLKDTKIKRWYGMFKPSKFIRSKFEDDKVKLVEKYNEQGYRDAKVLRDSVYSVDDRLVGVDISVFEGHQYYFRNIVWVGNEKYGSAELQRCLDIKKGDLYDQGRLDDRLNNDNDAVGNIYLDDGYLFFRAIPKEVAVVNDSVDVEIMIIEGPQAHINRINISGNTRTNDHVARRELYTVPGELFAKRDIINSVRELAQLGNFEPEKLVPTPIPDYVNKKVDIDYALVEKSNDMFELSAGWGGGYFVGKLGVSFNNFSTKNFFDKRSWHPLPQGDGQKLSLSFQSNGKYYQTYSISFVEPWLGGRKRNQFTISFYYTDVNYAKYYTSSSYWSQYYSSSMDYRMQVWGGAIGLGRRLSWPDNNFTLYNEAFFKRYKLRNYPYFDGFSANGIANELGLKIVFSRNSIDAPIYSRRGSSFSISGEFTPPYSKMNNKDYKTIDLDHKWQWVEYHKYGFEAKNFTQLWKDLVLHTKIAYGLSCFYTRDLGYSPFQGFTMGGDGMNYYSYGKDVIGLRGYDSETISRGGNVYAKYTFELRYPVILTESATIYGIGFMEGGNCWNEIYQFRPFDVYRAAGAGVRVYLPMLGMLGLDWGWGFDTPPGASERSGSKLQFTLGQSF